MKKSIMWVTAAPLFMNVCEIIVERFIWVNTGFGLLLRKHSHLLTSLKTQSNLLSPSGSDKAGLPSLKMTGACSLPKETLHQQLHLLLRVRKEEAA